MSNLEKFRELGISEQTLAALEKKGFEEPSPIQAQTIPLLLQGEKDIIGQAQTGTGKTAAFGIPIVEILQEHRNYVQSLIMAPTRELAIQVAEEINSLKGSRNLEVMPIYGGQSIEIQMRRLKKGVDIIVGTPGRLLDLMRRGYIKLDRVSIAVLDEADEMLNMGFIEDIEMILAETGPEKQMLMFSATMPPQIMSIAEKFMGEYEIVRVKKEQLTTNLTEQIYFEVKRGDKFEVLCRIIDIEPDFYGLVFCRTRNDVDEVARDLMNRGYSVEALHGDISQAQRNRVIEKIKSHSVNILVATDVAARGIDINNLTHVINFSIPQDPEAYVHRVGRTGRAGNEGTAITFVTPAEYQKLTQIKRFAKADIKKRQLPQARDIVKGKKDRIAEDVADMISGELHVDYMDFANELLRNNDPAVLIAAMLKQQYKDELLEESYSQINSSGTKIRDNSEPVDSGGRARLFVALGKKDDFNPKKLVDMIWDKAKVKSRLIQDVKCFDTFSFITVPFVEAEKLVEVFRREGRGNKPLMEMASEKKDKEGRSENDSDFKGGRNARPKKKKPFSKSKGAPKRK
ncbi:MAG: DEAD/DEAH box helicase [Victivallales bacterium]|nr:DEAD/DEAH box helicase [Victivallales bacterium]